MPAEVSSLIDRLVKMDTATLYESGATSTMSTEIAMLSGDRRVGGMALTVFCPPGDNLMIHAAVAAAKPGDVLVIQCHDPGFGVWGEVLTVAAQARQIAGIVVDGSVRDLGGMRSLGFPVFARGLDIRGTTKRDGGEVGGPITLGTVRIDRGDFVLADGDAIIVLPAAEAEAAASAGEARAAAEDRMKERLRAGETTLQILGIA